MQLKFYAKPDHVVHRPGPKMIGQVHQYVGRRFVRLDDEEGKKTGKAGQHVALKEPAVFDSEGPEAMQLLRYCAKGGLWPADEATASAAGVPFAKLKFDDAQAEWIPDLSPASAAKPSSKSE